MRISGCAQFLAGPAAAPLSGATTRAVSAAATARRRRISGPIVGWGFGLYPRGVSVEISPEPSRPERQAVVEALERLLEPLDARVAALYGSPWRLAGLRENADEGLRASSDC